MTLPTHNFITVGIVAILVLVLACGTEEDQDANQGGVAAGPTPTPPATAPESFPFPVVELIVGDARYPSKQGGYCWPDSRMDDTVASHICASMGLDWELDERVPVPTDVNPVVKIDFSDPTISLFANFYRDPQIRSDVDLVDISAEEDRVLDLSTYAKDDIYLRISGNWPQGQADYLFRLQPIPSGEALTGECSATEAVPLPLEYKVLNDPTPTGFDGGNSGSCTFSRPITSIVVMPNNGPGGSFHAETFHFAEPLHEVHFPLTEWGESEKTLELLAPGPYVRSMVAESLDGEQWVITDHVSAALDEVTVIASDEPTPRPPTPTASPKTFASRFPISWLWTDVNGDRVSGEIIYSFPGSDHCGWEKTTFLHIGSPLGASMEPRLVVHEYVKDPFGDLSRYGSRPPVGFEPDADLPSDAEFSGYVKNGVELWISQKQLDNAVYMVDGSAVEKWPRADPMFGCS